MKKLFTFLCFALFSMSLFGQTNIYEVVDYSPYVSDSLTYPILIPDGSIVIADYSLNQEFGIAHHDTLKHNTSFNIRLVNIDTIRWFSIFNEMSNFGIKVVNWITVYPEGNSNVLFLMDEGNRDCCRYSISDDDGKILLRGEIKNGITAISLEDLCNGLYYLEVMTCDRKTVYEFQITTNQY